MPQTEDQREFTTPSPGWGAGLFILAWAGVGWYGVLSNGQLMTSLDAPGLDPGPAILPMLVCGALSAGGLWLLLRGFVTGNAGFERLDSPGRFLTPVLFLTTALIAALLMALAGFRPPAFAFAAGWLFVLTGHDTAWWKRAAIAVVLSAIIIAGIEAIFVEVLRVPLP